MNKELFKRNKNRERNLAMVKLYEQGISPVQIAKEYKMTRQSVYWNMRKVSATLDFEAQQKQ